jgi:predicted nucleic acid-binding Zn finger protein
MRVTFEGVNTSYCGCADMVNTAVVNSTDQFGHVIGPKVTYVKVNLTYFAGLDITKIPHLVTNMTEVGSDLALVEYNITVTNIGQVNVTGIMVFDPRLGNYTLEKLLPGQNVTITPYPYYIITPDDVKYCSIDNVALVTGKDRCCNDVEAVAYANVPLAAKNLETYLKNYSYQLISYGYDIEDKGGDVQSLQDFEEKIRIQANRLMVLEDAMHKNVSSCMLPPQYNIATAQTANCEGIYGNQQVAYETVYPQVNKTQGE